MCTLDGQRLLEISYSFFILPSSGRPDYVIWMNTLALFHCTTDSQSASSHKALHIGRVYIQSVVEVLHGSGVST